MPRVKLKNIVELATFRRKNDVFRSASLRGTDFFGKPIAIFFEFLIPSSLKGQSPPKVDQIVGDHAESNPSIHSVLATIATPIQSVSPLQDADSTFTARLPLLGLSKPSRLLHSAKQKILRRPVRNRDVFHAHLLDSSLLSWRMKRCVCCNKIRN